MRGVHISCASCQDGFAEETSIYGGYNQAPASVSGEQASGLLRLLDNFTLYVQTDEEGSEDLVDLQDFTQGTATVKPAKHCFAGLQLQMYFCIPLLKSLNNHQQC